MKKTNVKSHNIRIVVVGTIFSIFLSVIGAKAVYLQVVQGPWLSRKAADQYEKSYQFLGKRGAIYDANQSEMAVSIDVTSIAAYPRHIEDPLRAANELSAALGVDRGDLRKRLASDRSFVWVKRQVSPKEKSAVVNMRLAGIDFIPEHTRVYPNKALAAQIIGFSGIDGHGLEGLEFFYDAYLQGKSRETKIRTDALGRRFELAESTQNFSGNNIVLTIDKTIQFITEQELSKAVTAFDAASGMAIVMSPKTGALLALAHYPSFNPNAFGRYDRELWRNRAITDPYEPGSTMKVFTVAAALEAGAVTKDSRFYCEKGNYRIGRNIVHDHHPHESLSVLEIIKFSSNIGAIKIMEGIGQQSLYDMLRQFGFGSETGIDCPGETPGTLSHPNTWSQIDAATIAFGQGISVSAVQLITAVSAIANDGILMWPHIVQVITNSYGRPIKAFPPKKVRRVVSVQTAQTIKRMMKAVTDEDGTGKNAALAGFAVCGKTGTAQKTNNAGVYERGSYIASFVGFLPMENPQLAILVVVDEPKKEHYGSQVAAPAFHEIARKVLNYMNVHPETPGERLTARRLLEVEA